MADHGSTRRGLQSPFYQDQADDEVGLEYREMLPWGEYQSPECLNRFVAGSEPSSSSSAFRQQVTIASPSRHENRNLVGPQGSAHCAGEITIRPLVQIDSDCARDVYDRGTPAFPLASIPFSPALGDQYDHGQVQMRLDNVDFFSQRWHQNPPQSFEEAHSDSNSSHTGYHGSPLSVFSTLQAGYRVQTQVGNSIGEGHTPDLMTMNPQEIRGLVEHTLECTQPIESTPNAYSSVNFLGASDGHHTTARAIECFEQYTEGSSTRDEPWTPWTMLHEGQGESLRAKYGQEPEEASAFAGGGFERAKDDYSTASSGQRQSTPASSVVSVSIELSDSTVTLRPGTQASASEFSEIVLSPYNGQISSPLGVPMETAPGWSQKPSSAECGSNFR
ncbi:hypothetical protein BDV95DRAFT_89424 [Massariosphaeria phaeospora]|uniref:Uncharacterized protein n=1 Tax=Massariosphaeria phaeospora TaxID=100035 RepID=A0A7C8M647_9PLEO|nr:hypothetical protein BDV95DRAFT_89424 [Massariosphaeria phaeospora]